MYFVLFFCGLQWEKKSVPCYLILLEMEIIACNLIQIKPDFPMKIFKIPFSHMRISWCKEVSF